MSAKSGNMAIAYSAIAVLSVLLLIAYFLWERKKEKHLTLLFSCVAVANCGYFLQSIAASLRGAMWGNRPSLVFADCIELLHLWLQRI